MPNCGSNFYSRSLTLLVHILKMIDENFAMTKISQILDIEKSHVSYYVRRAKSKGYVSEVFHDKFKRLEQTQGGKNFLTMYEKSHHIIHRQMCYFTTNNFVYIIFGPKYRVKFDSHTLGPIESSVRTLFSGFEFI